jgi:hypothetical protein
MMAVTAAVLVGPVVAFSGGAVAFAGVDCGIGDPPWYVVSVSNKDEVFTHQIAYALIPPHGSATRTIGKATTLSGSIDIQVGVSAEANVIFGKAGALLNVTFHGEASATDTWTMSITAPNPTANYHRFIFYGGALTANGRWTRYYCSNGIAKVGASGTWFSWTEQSYGAIRCDDDAKIKSQFGLWSVEYKAVSSCD